MEPKLKEILEGVDFVSTTDDVWKSCNKGFFGLTVHWIEPSTLKCCKAAQGLLATILLMYLLKR